MRRAVGFILVLLLLAVLVSAGAMAALYLSLGGEPSIPSGATLVLRPGGGDLQEVPPDDVLQYVSGAEARTLRGYIEMLRRAAADDRIAAVLLRPRGFTTPFWGKVQELRDALVAFRRSGKPVIAFLEYASEREYYLATAADRIYMLPTSTLDLTGVVTYELFLRGALDWIGTYPDFLRIGDYKTAVNLFTEKTFTPAHREMSESLTADTFAELVRTIADGRRKSEADVRALIDNGPFLPDEALRQGLIDDLAYEDQLDDLVGAVGPKPLRLVESDDYARVGRGRFGGSGARIAVINAVGTITSGPSTFDPVNGQVLGADSVIKSIREVRADRSIRAIVLRVDSPGGSSTASDRIWRELTITKNDDLHRPLIVSMSDLAASGGYYLAMAGDVIVAQPGTLTGSIGIYTGKFATGGTLEKLGARVEATSAGAHAEMYSPTRPFTDEERAHVQESLQAFYDQFVEKVAEARQTTPEKIDQIGQGRVWTGRQARDLGLVDELGGLDTAIAVAKQRAGIPPDEDVELVVYPRRRSLYEVLADRFQGPGFGAADQGAAALTAVLGPGERRALGALVAPARLFMPGELLAHMPYVFLR